MGENMQMKTAEQMVQYCIKNGYDIGEEEDEQVCLDYFSIIEQSLAEKEYVITCFMGILDLENPDYKQHQIACIVTNGRIILSYLYNEEDFFSSNYNSSFFKSIHFQSINNITVVNEDIIINTRSGRFIIGTTIETAENFRKMSYYILCPIKQDDTNKDYEIKKNLRFKRRRHCYKRTTSHKKE